MLQSIKSLICHKNEKDDSSCEHLSVTLSDNSISLLSSEYLNEIIATIYTKYEYTSVKIDTKTVPTITLSSKNPESLFEALDFFTNKLESFGH